MEGTGSTGFQSNSLCQAPRGRVNLSEKHTQNNRQPIAENQLPFPQVRKQSAKAYI